MKGLAWNKPASLLDYIHRESCIVVDETHQCLAHGKQWFDHVEDNYNELVSSLDNINPKEGVLFPNNLHIRTESTFNDLYDFYGFELSELSDSKNNSNNRRVDKCFYSPEQAIHILI